MKTGLFKSHDPSGLSWSELLIAIFVLMAVFCGLLLWGVSYKRRADRSANILNIRNCQQMMRGQQGMYNQNIGDPFTRMDLEKYMHFPQDVNASVTYQAGDVHTPLGVLWLRVSPAGDVGGRYGFSSSDDYRDW